MRQIIIFSKLRNTEWNFTVKISVPTRCLTGLLCVLYVHFMASTFNLKFFISWKTVRSGNCFCVFVRGTYMTATRHSSVLGQFVFDPRFFLQFPSPNLAVERVGVRWANPFAHGEEVAQNDPGPVVPGFFSSRKAYLDIWKSVEIRSGSRLLVKLYLP